MSALLYSRVLEVTFSVVFVDAKGAIQHSKPFSGTYPLLPFSLSSSVKRAR